MGIKSFNPYTPSRRHMTSSDFNEITKSTPEKSLVVSLKKNAGRNNQGNTRLQRTGRCPMRGKPRIRRAARILYTCWIRRNRNSLMI